MIPVHCRVKHDPDAGQYGDCVRACVASIMEIDAEAVPHFFHDDCNGDIGMDRVRAWLREQGLAPFFASFDGSHPMADILAMQKMQNPDVHYMLFGATDGGDHVVVCHNGKVAHNPSWYPTPIVGPGAHGVWTIMVIARP
jgi:hypothetical protein